MTNRIENLEQILTSMNICDSAKTNILGIFGNRPKVTKANLRKAIKFRGATWFLMFAQQWMKMDSELLNWISDQGDAQVWARRYRGLPFYKRQKNRDKVVIEAVYAYYQEWRKP